MLPNQAAKPCMHKGFEVGTGMKNNEQHKKKLNSCFHRTFLQLFVNDLYVADVLKKHFADWSVGNDLLFDLFGK